MMVKNSISRYPAHPASRAAMAQEIGENNHSRGNQKDDEEE